MHSAKHLAGAGYTPLPVKAKRKFCDWKGWQNAKPFGGRAPNLGLNLVGLAMIDVDIDAEQAEVDKLMEIIDPAGAYPLRWREDTSRCAFLVRITDHPETHERFATSKWAEGKVEFKVGRGEFMLGWGHHPSGAQLNWEAPKGEGEPEALTSQNFPPYGDLPAIDLASLRQLRDTLEECLTKTFGAPVKETHDVSGIQTSCDLHWDMVFTHEGGSNTLRELYEGPKTDVFVNLTPWRADSDSLAGHLMHSKKFNGPVLTDFVTQTVHLMPEDASGLDEDLEDMPDFEALTQTQERASEAMKKVERVQRLIFIRETGQYGYVDDPTGSLMSREGALHEFAAKEAAELSRSIKKVQRQIWDPRQPELSIVENEFRGWAEHNTFCLPRHAPEGGDLAGFWAFMRHLLPDENERETVVRWLAAKAQRPHDRHFSLVLVGPEGSGKGTLWKLISNLFSHDMVSQVGTIQSIYRAQYHDILYRKLFVLVDEVSSSDATSREVARERLKAFCEPQASWKLLNLKGGRQVQSLICATVGLATNHFDGVPVEVGDRRFFVATTGPEMNPMLIRDINLWLGDRKNLGALWRFLRRHSLDGFDSMRAPSSSGKEVMADSSKGEVDDVATTFMELVKDAGGFYRKPQLDRFLVARGVDVMEQRDVRRILRARTSRHIVNLTGNTYQVRRLLHTRYPTRRGFIGQIINERVEALDAALDALA